MDENKKIRIVLTVKQDKYDSRFSGFVPIDCLDNEACLSLVKHHYSDFRHILPDEVTHKTLLEETIISRGDEGYFDALFQDQIFPDVVTAVLNSTFYKEKVLQNLAGNIWVLPACDVTSQEYINDLITWAEEDSTDLYLLIHDKDIYDTQGGQIEIITHRVDIKDDNLCKEIVNPLKDLIQNNKVFVFIHDTDRDDYYKYIVSNPRLSTIAPSSIVEILEGAHENLAFTNQLGQLSTYEEMMKFLTAAGENSKKYDFSKKFI